MLNEKVVTLADALIRTQLKERKKQLPREILEIANAFNARGTYYSSMHLQAVEELCGREIEIRMRIVVQAYQKVLSELNEPPTSELAELLKRKLDQWVPLHDDYKHAPQELASRANLLSQLTDTVNEARIDAVNKLEAEIEVFFAGALQRSKSSGAQVGSTAITVYGPVGAVMSGSVLSGNVIQNVTASDKENLLKALELLEDALRKQSPSDFSKEEVIELVTESKTEVSKTKPNWLRLRTIVTAIGESIQTVASLGDIYQKVKAALLPFGVMLP